MSLAVQIPQFEGPLALLLFLIRKEEMDICDIDIHLITSQYLDYIKKMKQFDLELAGDFVAMAATLLQIKSRILLPNYNEGSEEEVVEDPRKVLVNQLLEYQKYQEAARRIYERSLLGRDVFRRGRKTDKLINIDDGEIILDEGGLFALIGLYRGAVKRAKNAIHRVARKTQSIAARIIEIKDRLVVGQRVVMRDLLSQVDDVRGQILVTFLSCLELGKMGFVSVYQSEVYGDIYLTAQKAIDRDIVNRVEEYQSVGSEDIADKIMDEAATQEEPLDEVESPVQEEVVARPEELKLEGFGEEPSEILSEVNGSENGLMVGQAGEEMATDDDIEAAEAILAQSESEKMNEEIDEPEIFKSTLDREISLLESAEEFGEAPSQESRVGKFEGEI